MSLFDQTWLDCLAEGERRALLAEADRGAYGAGRTIVWRGEVLARLLLVEKGRVEAAYQTKLGPAVVELKPGDFLGETVVLEGRAPSESLARSIEDGTLVLELPAAPVRALMESNKEFRHRLLERTAERRAALGAAIMGWRGFDPVAALRAARSAPPSSGTPKIC